MALYEYQCHRCGEVFEQSAPMAESGKKRRCRCGGLGKRVVSLPRLRTETTLTDYVKRSYAVAGHRVESWRDVKRLEKDGACVLVNRHDLDYAEGRNKKIFRENLRAAAQKLEDRVVIRSGRKRKSRVA